MKFDWKQNAIWKKTRCHCTLGFTSLFFISWKLWQSQLEITKALGTCLLHNIRFYSIINSIQKKSCTRDHFFIWNIKTASQSWCWWRLKLTVGMRSTWVDTFFSVQKVEADIGSCVKFPAEEWCWKSIQGWIFWQYYFAVLGIQKGFSIMIIPASWKKTNYNLFYK